jgi:hypothetical protein
MEQCVTPEFQWVKTLPLIEYVAKPAPPLFEEE